MPQGSNDCGIVRSCAEVPGADSVMSARAKKGRERASHHCIGRNLKRARTGRQGLSLDTTATGLTLADGESPPRPCGSVDFKLVWSLPSSCRHRSSSCLSHLCEVSSPG